ncbi:hypothetical protein PtA15_1A842 [Puccinia triticina]|uniref:Uncharacterized protein n=1 Tax=Puccinia triticina TaxID=208348 RepID=A0ABY7CCA8_9BASI|nr:uncharacterized protein PtA15_1A842 [Puccinia triticina]WAQ81500.1 hypothetical protein PtA15_1A842 [Puccinia triticina]
MAAGVQEGRQNPPISPWMPFKHKPTRTMKTRSQQESTRTRKQPVVIIYKPPSSQQLVWDPTQLESVIQDRQLSTRRWVDETRSYGFEPELFVQEFPGSREESVGTHESLESKETEERNELNESKGVKESKEMKEMKESKGVKESKELKESTEPKPRKTPAQQKEPTQRKESTTKTEPKRSKQPHKLKQPEEKNEFEKNSNCSVSEGSRPIEDPAPRSESTLEYLQLPPASSSSQATRRAPRSLHEQPSPDRNRSEDPESNDTPTNKRIHDRRANGPSEPSSEPKKARKISYPGRSQPGPTRLSGYDAQDPFGFVHAERGRTEALSADDHPPPAPQDPPVNPPPQDLSDPLNNSDLSLADLLNLRKKPARKQASRSALSRKGSAAPVPARRQRQRAQKSAKRGPEKSNSSLNKGAHDENHLGDQELPPTSPSSSSRDPTGQLTQGSDDEERSPSPAASPMATNPPSRARPRRKSPSSRKILKPKENIPSRPRRSSSSNAKGCHKTGESKSRKTVKGRNVRRPVGAEKGRPRTIDASETVLSGVDEDESRARRLSYYRALDELQFEEEVVIDL